MECPPAAVVEPQRRFEFDPNDHAAFAATAPSPTLAPAAGVIDRPQRLNPFSADVGTRLSLLCVLRC